MQQAPPGVPGAPGGPPSTAGPLGSTLFSTANAKANYDALAFV